MDVGRGIGGYRGDLGGVYARSRERSDARECQEGGYRDASGREPWSVRALIKLIDSGCCARSTGPIRSIWLNRLIDRVDL